VQGSLPSRPGETELARWQRQVAFAALGPSGQRALSSAAAVVIGMGGLGSWAADLLARAGVGMLRLVDDDLVDLTNIHRQDLYDETDARAAAPKVHAAARRLTAINSALAVEPMAVRATSDSIEGLVRGVALILDGTDNFATRYLINDVAIKTGTPWVFAGVIGAQAQTMTIVPGRTPCLRCVLDTPPSPCTEKTCRSFGVLGPAVAAVAAIQASEAVKILSGHGEQASPYLTKFDLWNNTMQRIVPNRPSGPPGCVCCQQREFEYLEP
jgi:molybdopterin/thiamine biosynthesis adenylyltransferase